MQELSKPGSLVKDEVWKSEIEVRSRRNFVSQIEDSETQCTGSRSSTHCREFADGVKEQEFQDYLKSPFCLVTFHRAGLASILCSVSTIRCHQNYWSSYSNVKVSLRSPLTISLLHLSS